MRNTKFNICLETGNFLVTSYEFDFLPHTMTEITFPINAVRYFFESEWSFENELVSFKMNGSDATYLLSETDHKFHILAVNAKSHHFSVMRYERL